MKGIEKIIATRSKGLKPVNVWLWVGYDKPVTPSEWDVVMLTPTLSEDLIPLIGLNVIMLCKNYDESTLAVWNELKKIIASGAISFRDWGDPDSTFVYSKEFGERSVSNCVRG